MSAAKASIRDYLEKPMVMPKIGKEDPAHWIALVRRGEFEVQSMRTQFLSILRRAALPSLLVMGLCRPTVAASFPSPVVPCPLPGKESDTFLTLDEVTPPIFHELQRRFGNPPGNGIDMAPRDGNWQVTDALIGTDPPYRFDASSRPVTTAAAGMSGTSWAAWGTRIISPFSICLPVGRPPIS
jgi:hypothetical protein